MAKGLFKVSTGRDIYLTMDLWAVLSPLLSQKGKKYFDNKTDHRFKNTKFEDRRNTNAD